MRVSKFSRVFVVVLVLQGCASSRPSKERSLIVAVSIHPLVGLTREVAGGRIEILRLVPPGASPHAYEPTPSQVAQMSRADVLFLIGMGLEFWWEDLVSAAGNPELVVVETSAGIPAIDGNPHVWLDPMNGVSQVEVIRDTLKQVDPEAATQYDSNAARFIGELQGLDREIMTEIEGWTQHAFVAFHPAWAYFARRYGLEQAAVVEEAPGHEPSVSEMARAIEIARRVRARAIFADPQLPGKLAQTIAEESGVRVVYLDPLGATLAPDDYPGLIRYNVQAMAEVMR